MIIAGVAVTLLASATGAAVAIRRPRPVAPDQPHTDHPAFSRIEHNQVQLLRQTGAMRAVQEEVASMQERQLRATTAACELMTEADGVGTLEDELAPRRHYRHN